MSFGLRVVIVRHADPEYSVDGLTESGKLEAKALAKRLASGFDGEITHLYTSPLGRARATVRAILLDTICFDCT